MLGVGARQVVTHVVVCFGCRVCSFLTSGFKSCGDLSCQVQVCGVRFSGLGFRVLASHQDGDLYVFAIVTDLGKE